MNIQTLILSITLVILIFLFYGFKTQWQIIWTALSAVTTAVAYKSQGTVRNIIKNSFIILSFIVTFIALFFTAAVRLNPPVTADGHRVMAVGQLFFSVPAGLFCAILLGFIYFKKLNTADQLEKRFFLIMTVVLSIVFIIDYLIP